MKIVGVSLKDRVYAVEIDHPAPRFVDTDEIYRKRVFAYDRAVLIKHARPLEPFDQFPADSHQERARD